MAFICSGRWGRHTLAVSTLLFSGAAFALNYDVQYTATAPTIDGTVDAAWSSASPAATNFVQHNSPATASTEQTSVRMLWGDTHLYVMFEAQDTNTVAPATADYEGFDFGTPQDTAEIFLDPAWFQTTAGNDRLYHIAVDPKADTFTYTEAGQNQTSWKLSDASDLAFASTTGGWAIEMAIAWTDLNSSQSLSPGQILGPPTDGVIWGAQFGRLHGGEGNGAIIASKWEPTSGFFRARRFGSITFKGGPAPGKPDLSGLNELYSTSFEAPAYTVGETASGIEEWMATSPPVWPVTNSVAASGSQALQGNTGSGTTIRNVKRTTNTETAQYLQYSVRMPAEISSNGYRHVLYIGGEYTTGSTTLGQIWFTCSTGVGANAFSVYYYEQENEGLVASTIFPGMIAFDKWMYVTVKVNPDENTYEVWINDTKLVRPTGEDYFTVRYRSVFNQFAFPQFYNKNYGTEPVYFDDVLMAEEPQSSGIADWNLF